MDGQTTNSCSRPSNYLNGKILQLLTHAVAPATQAAYRRAYENYRAFHITHYRNLPVFPIKPIHLAQFIAFQLEAGYKGSSYLQRIMGLDNPSDHFLVKQILVSTHKATHSKDKRLPITLPILNSLLSSLPRVVDTSFEITLYKAMFLLAFYALLRIGEMATTRFGKANILQFHNIEILRTNSQVSGIRIHIQHHKHAKSVPAPLEIQPQETTNCPVHALLNYIQLRGNMAGPLFLAESKSPISAAQFTAVLCNCVNTIGLDINRYTPHSFRIGGTSFAHENNFNETQLRRLGRWHSTAYLRYIRSPVLSAKYNK